MPGPIDRDLAIPAMQRVIYRFVAAKAAVKRTPEPPSKSFEVPNLVVCSLPSILPSLFPPSGAVLARYEVQPYWPCRDEFEFV